MSVVSTTSENSINLWYTIPAHNCVTTIGGIPNGINNKEILRLNHEGYSQRQIKSSVHYSRHTVRDVLAVAEKQNLTWSLDESVTNEQIEALLFPERYSAVSMYLEPDYSYIHSELYKRSVALTLLWNEYVQKAEALGKKPYMTTQFGDKYRASLPW